MISFRLRILGQTLPFLLIAPLALAQTPASKAPSRAQATAALNQPANNLRDTVQRFSRQSAAADVAFVFYAGHGVEVGGRNYLVPVDAHLKTDMDVVFEAISLDLVMQAVEPAKSLRIIVLDACRDNPFARTMKRTIASRALGRGLAGIEVYYPDHTPEMVDAYLTIAGRYRLVATGGTDYHGGGARTGHAQLGSIPMPAGVVPALRARWSAMRALPAGDARPS